METRRITIREDNKVAKCTENCQAPGPGPDQPGPQPGHPGYQLGQT